MLSLLQKTGHGLVFAAFAMVFLTGAAQAAPDDSAKLSRLALDVTRAEDIRAVKRLQIAYAHYSQFGLWSQMAALFTADGEAIYGTDDIKGEAAIGQYYRANWGGGREGLPKGGLHTQLIDTPVLNLSADGKSAKGRWQQFTMKGAYGGDASFECGIMENEYVKDSGVWKISRIHYYPVTAGPYADGWKMLGKEVNTAPFHYTSASAGNPVPAIPDGMPIPATTASLAALNRRIEAMNSEDKVANLQNAYNYYISRKMWDDASDLFADDGVLEDADVGIYAGRKSIRRSYERFGPQGLQKGQLNNHITFSLQVTVSPDGMEATSRAIAFDLLGDHNIGTAAFKIDVLQNRYLKGRDGVWRIREMRTFPIMATDYYQGWNRSQLITGPVTGANAPDEPVPASDRGTQTDGVVPAFWDTNPVTGKTVLPPTRLAARSRLLAAATGSAVPATPLSDLDAAVADAERRILISNAYIAAENLGHALGNNIDDQSWHNLGLLFARDGWRAKSAIAFCIGPAHAEMCETNYDGVAAKPRLQSASHWMVQPVIDVALDGKSAHVRHYLIHFNTSSEYGSGLSDGMYPNNAIKMEDGIFKLDVGAPDQPFFTSPSWKAGWARDEPKGNGRGPAVKQAIEPARDFPADIPRAGMPLRHHGSVPGDMILWPDIKPMWFSYKNPVSGRLPPLYCPNIKTCEADLIAQKQMQVEVNQKMLPVQ